ncbi:lysozyme family protein [Rhizobium sp. BK196]|uniref:glycoside hydrolase family 108 protein n=1 Tax=Rhizobium sp. BK196 TaxID=2587073 RepID=UPI001615889D|nr:glycoside hydrolase family 108 protein [Rhizobium sp. BK196]MBB3313627.1 lysozyme family protein [Rhizobium sp. BK196]
MVDEFQRSLQKVLVHEGGFSNHPKDPGGATMKGVTQRVYDEYRQSINLEPQSVQLIRDNELQAIYRKRYWEQAKCDKLRSGVSYVVFDGSVNSGVSQSVKWLQRALQGMGLYQGAIDGVIGQGTLLAAASVNDDDALIAAIIERRKAFLKALKTFSTFGKGWMARVAGVLAVGQAWARGSVGPDIAYVAGGDAKAFISDAKPAPVMALADISSGAGVSGGGVTGSIAYAKDQLAQFAGNQFVDNALLYLTLASLGLLGAGAAWRWYATRKRNRRADVLDLPTAPTSAQAPA